MKSALVKIVVITVVVMSIAAPVSAKTAGNYTGRAIDQSLAAVSAAPDLVDWYENWDSYPTGQNMHGIGGWKGWFNTPSATAYTSDAQRTSLPNSIDLNGASDLVHEYAIDAGVWTYTAWQYVPTDFAGTSYFILLNDYDDGGASLNWSVQVNFDATTNLVTNDGAAGGTLPLIKGQWVEIRDEINLDTDMQMFYYGGTLLFMGSWSEGLSGGGLTSIAAVDLFANGATPVYYDDLSLVEFGVEQNLTCGGIVGQPAMDPYGNIYLRWKVQAVDNAGIGVPLVVVAADLWWPTGGPVSRTRIAHDDGFARFPWGSHVSGNWVIDVTNMTLDGYTFVDGPQCSAEGTW
jgi:hypothetical protein